MCVFMLYPYEVLIFLVLLLLVLFRLLGLFGRYLNFDGAVVEPSILDDLQILHWRVKE